VLTPIDGLARCVVLRTLLDALTRRYGGYEIVAHWTQGEAHHDVVVMLPLTAARDLPGRVLVVATTGNAIIKEVLAFAVVPTRDALWHLRCPEMMETTGEIAPILAQAKTEHWVDPCDLLDSDEPVSASAPTEHAPTFDPKFGEPPTQRSR
jgi:hypothetical protein